MRPGRPPATVAPHLEVTAEYCDLIWSLAVIEARRQGRPVLYVFANLLRERIVRSLAPRNAEGNSDGHD